MFVTSEILFDPSLYGGQRRADVSKFSTRTKPTMKVELTFNLFSSELMYFHIPEVRNYSFYLNFSVLPSTESK